MRADTRSTAMHGWHGWCVGDAWVIHGWHGWHGYLQGTSGWSVLPCQVARFQNALKELLFTVDELTRKVQPLPRNELACPSPMSCCPHATGPSRPPKIAYCPEPPGCPPWLPVDGPPGCR